MSGELFSDAVARHAAELGNRRLPYVAAARRMHHRDGELEIDEGSVISESDDAGEYVLAWLWIADDDITEEDRQ